MPEHLVTALFDGAAEARGAADRLVGMGLDRATVRLIPRDAAAPDAAAPPVDEAGGGAWDALAALRLPDADRHGYAEALRRGGVLLAASVGAHPDGDVARAQGRRRRRPRRARGRVVVGRLARLPPWWRDEGAGERRRRDGAAADGRPRAAARRRSGAPLPGGGTKVNGSPAPPGGCPRGFRLARVAPCLRSGFADSLQAEKVQDEWLSMIVLHLCRSDKCFRKF